MSCLTVILGLLFRFINKHTSKQAYFSKRHRIEETWQYNILNTVAVNQIADPEYPLSVIDYYKIYKPFHYRNQTLLSLVDLMVINITVYGSLGFLLAKVLMLVGIV
jgi:hypothetical protein